jgi:DNA-binding SARP family transcriptional activator/streptogramin lyase
MPVPRDELGEVLWESFPPATWEKALRVLVSKLRKVLAESFTDSATDLTAAFGCYRLDLPPESWVDILTAENAAQEAEDLLAADELDAAIIAATLAESLLRQPFMPGDNGTWVHAKRRELAEVRARALVALAESYLRSGKAEAAVRWAEQAVEVELFRESGYRQLMAAHVAAGNRAEALRVYEQCRRLLADELGAYPSPETEAIYRQLLGDPSTERDAATGRRGDASEPGQLVQPESVAAGTTVVHGPSDRRPGSVPRKPIVLSAALLAVAATAAAILSFVGRGGPAPTILPNSVVRVDPATLKVTHVASVGNAPDLIIASGGYLWITNYILRDQGSGAPRNAGDHTLTRLEPSTGKAIVVGGGLAPCGMTADPSGDVWVANCYPPNPGLRDDVIRVDARSLAFKRTLPAPGGDGFYRGLAYGGGSLWLSQIVGGDVRNANAVTQINPETHRERTINLERAASDLAWSGGYGDLWIDNFPDGSLTRMHPATGATETVGDVANAPTSPVVDGNVVWIADWTAPQLVRVSAVGSPRIHRIPLPGGTSGVWTVAVGAGAVWATTPRDHALWRIDPKTSKTTRVNLRYLPTGVTADENDVWVTVRGQ